ncbi:MAG TPA: malto-oligosyltrehalose synthase [Puia sp.]|nr:malto-oligosyltrehalose synthase [Puia sp.]
MYPPSSTYRIQLNDRFTFRDLEEIIDYLHQLGVGAIYASPITRALKGSSHGYDVIDPLILSPEIGTEKELERLASTLEKYDMTWLQDIVPNHMAYDSNNPWLYDVLERGKDSLYHSFFDITDHPVELLGEQLMAPFLGRTLTECLQKGELSLQFTEKGFIIRYYDKDYPVAPWLYPWICTVAEGYPADLIPALDQLVRAAKGSASDQATAKGSAAGWAAAKNKWLLAVSTQKDFRSFISGRIAFINERYPLLETLLQDQFYQLTAAHLAASRINYRRFFTVNSLICLRMEEEAVFDAYHKRIHYWYQRGWIQGLRIDHIDGLADPKKYLQRLRRLFGEDCYIIAEKILTGDERLPESWGIAGTTGYDFLAAAGQLLTDPDGSRSLLEFYKEKIIALPDYPDVVFERKYTFLVKYMGGELDNLLYILTGDSLFTLGQDTVRLREALAVLMASFPVYRAYPDEEPLTRDDEKVIYAAFDQARRLGPGYGAELGCLEFFLKGPSSFRNRLMQYTGPLAAKGIEDTTFYVYNPYIALNEVGDSPGKAGLSNEEFHQKMLYRQASFPRTMNGSSTHDTKRGEDSRIRLSLLSSIPQEWIDAVSRWRQINSPFVQEVGGRPAPSPNDEYLIYQALLGSFPENFVVSDSYRGRIADYLTKALREAKAETDYEHPDEGYEQACQAFATALLKKDSAFLHDFIPFAVTIVRQSYTYSLSLLLMKLTAPGIPDIYQGAELWDISLVDPDNRRPVDYALRSGILRQIMAEEARGADALFAFLRTHRDKGVEKLFTIYRTLNFRKRHPRLFTEGEYLPVVAEGPVLAYIRHLGADWVLVIVPLIRSGRRLPDTISLKLPGEAPASWTHLLTDAVFAASGSDLVLEELWRQWPVALLSGTKS